jgi:hypothetical protein
MHLIMITVAHVYDKFKHRSTQNINSVAKVDKTNRGKHDLLVKTRDNINDYSSLVANLDPESKL